VASLPCDPARGYCAELENAAECPDQTVILKGAGQETTVKEGAGARGRDRPSAQLVTCRT
jgi:hypothetical protein